MASSSGPNDRRAAASREGWRVMLLGLPRVERADPAVTVPLSPKDAALLAIVALDGPVAAEHVAALLWPAATGDKADASLRQREFRLRRKCGVDLIANGPLLRLARGIQFDVPIAVAQIATDQHASREELLGDLDFDDQPELADWVRSARSRWHERRDAALAAAAEHCESTGDFARGLVYAQRLVDSDPLSEHAQRRVMRLHYLRSDCSAAIAVFERFERRLKDELGARPSAETIELMTTIERGAAKLPTRRAIVPASLMRPPQLVGRSAEAAALAHAWAGQRVFALLGEAGIGKSRLLQEFAARDDGIVIVQARPGDGSIAYAVLARLLRLVLAQHTPPLSEPRRQELGLVLPELGNAVALAGEAQRLLLHRAVDATLADAADQGLRAIIVDDLHFADDASVELLQSLTQSEALSVLNWGFAQRPAEASSVATTVRKALEETQRLESIRLGPLTVSQMAELIESLSLPGLDAQQLAPALLKHTGGNPMFALETLKDLMLSEAPRDGRLPQPTTVAALIERRLAQLTPGALKLARTAALAGASFSADLAATVLDMHPLDIAEPWRELESAQVIRDGAFAHDLIFEATRASVPEPIGQLLHRRIAHYLVASHAHPANIARHWAGALEWSLAGEAWVRAARDAQSASQRGHEIEHWLQARLCFDKAGDAERSFDARCESITALIVVRGVAHADTVIDALLADARSDRERVSALTARAMAALMAANHPKGVAAAVQARELAQGLDSPWPRFEAARLNAVGLAQDGRAIEGLALIEPFREGVDREGSNEQKGHFWSDYAYVLNSARRLRDTATALERAIEYARSLGDLTELATLTSNLATVKGNLGNSDEALALAHRALAIQTQLGATDGPAGGVVETYVGLYCGMVGRYGEALEHLDSALARFRRDRQSLWTAVASNHKAQVLIDLGQFARARQTLRYESPPVESVRARGATLAARLDRALGQRGDAALTEALEILARGGDPHVRMHALLDEVERLEPTDGVARCDEVMRMAGELEFVGVSMRAGLLRARSLHLANQSNEGAALLRGLLPQLDKVRPVDMYMADAWWIGVRVFEACGASDEAAKALAQGTRWIRQIALPNVPDSFKDSFLQRNPTNRALLAAERRHLA
jgi:DNA-binding SARP family transcriptional activator/tetratricopeptide (TPR) repeat protein